MKNAFLIVMMLFPQILLGSQTKILLKAQEQWSGYQSCSEQVKNELELINCLSPYLSSKITRVEKGKLASFLIMEFSFSELRICDDKKDLVPMRNVKDEIYFCMSVLGNKSKLPGYVIFEAEKNSYRIKAIKYNF